MPSDTHSDRDASPTDPADEDLDRATESANREIEAGPDNIPRSRRERAKEDAEELLEAQDGDGLMAATSAFQQAQGMSQEAAQRLQRAQQQLEQAKQLREDAATTERILSKVVSERTFVSEAGADLATLGDSKDGEDS